MPVDFLSEHRVLVSLVLLGAMLVAFTLERLPPSGIAVIGAAAFVLCGYVDEESLFAVFSNPAAIAIGAMLILSAALVRTGTLEAMATRVLALAKSRPTLAVVLVFGVALLGSAFVNSTPVVVILIPLMVPLAAALDASPKRLLIPLSYIAILGGTCTLIGTSTNLLVNSIAREEGLAGFGIFDITVVGLFSALTGMAFLWATGRWLLPRDRIAGSAATREEPPDILTECRIGGDYEALGEPWNEADLLVPRGVRLVQILRGGERIAPEGQLITEKDRVILRVTSQELATLAAEPGLDVGLRVRRPPEEGEEIRLVRATITDGGVAAGRHLVEAHFVSRFPITVNGVRRRRNLAGPDLGALVLKAGDQLWLSGSEAVLERLADDPALVMSAMPTAKPFLRRRALAAISTLAAVVLAAVFGIASLPVAAIVGIGLLLAIRSLDTKDAWAALDADVLILIYAMLVVGTGLQATGAVDAVIGVIAPTLGELPPLGVLFAIYALTSVLTETVTNNAVAVIMTPLVIGLAETLGIDPVPLVVTVMFAASASFATPIGYQTNTLVHAAGGYRFAEFLKVGVPMNLVVGAISCVAIDLWFG